MRRLLRAVTLHALALQLAGATHRGGTLASTTGSFRAALDAALSSPSGRGVLVDGGGVLVGTVTAEQVLAALQDG